MLLGRDVIRDMSSHTFNTWGAAPAPAGVSAGARASLRPCVGDHPWALPARTAPLAPLPRPSRSKGPAPRPPGGGGRGRIRGVRGGATPAARFRGGLLACARGAQPLPGSPGAAGAHPGSPETKINRPVE
eukprot:1185127-Prorocentrum_minimum.AAC.2